MSDTISAKPTNAPENPSAQSGTVALRRNPDYVKWFVSDVAADGGAAILSFATPLIALAITGSLTLSGAIAGITALARVLAMLPGGVMADRHDRKKLLLIGHGCGAILWIAGITLFLCGLLNAFTLTFLGIAAGVRDGLFGAVSTPALRHLVPPAQLPKALAANQARDGTIQLASGPIGGALVTLAIWAPFAARTIGHILAWVAVRTIKTDLHPVTDSETPSSPIEQVKAGVVWLAYRRTITTILIIAAVLSFAITGTVQAIVLHFAAAGQNTTSIGLVPTALAGGMIVGSMCAGPIAKKFPTGVVSIVSTGLMCVAFAALVATENFKAILAILAVSAIALPVFNSAASGWAISQIPDAKIGVISAASGLLNSILLPFAPLIAGFGLDMFGYSATTTLFVAIMLASALAMTFTREFRRLPRPDKWELELDA